MRTAVLLFCVIATCLKECDGFTASRGIFNSKTFSQFRIDAAPGPTMAKAEQQTVVSADGEVSYDEGEFLYDEDDEDDFEDDDRDGFEKTTRKSGRPLGNNE